MPVNKESAAKALQTKRDTQIRYGRITGLPAETSVRVETPNERRYHGKKGVVKEHNLGEVGVDFGGALVWFLPAQLIKL